MTKRKKYKLAILPPAMMELKQIAEFHFQNVGSVSARKITDKILDGLDKICSFPLSCPLAPEKKMQEDGYRILVCEKYICVYRPIDDTIYVYHIITGATEYPNLF